MHCDAERGNAVQQKNINTQPTSLPCTHVRRARQPPFCRESTPGVCPGGVEIAAQDLSAAFRRERHQKQGRNHRTVKMLVVFSRASVPPSHVQGQGASKGKNGGTKGKGASKGTVMGFGGTISWSK